MWKFHLSLNPIGKLWAFSIFSSRTFCFGIHTCHRRVYIYIYSLLYVICVQRLIYFYQSVRMSFRIFHVPVKFRTICDEVILLSTDEGHIWFPLVMFSTLIIRVVWIYEWFIIALILSLVLEAFFSLVWSFTVTAPWLRFVLIYISYWIVPNSSNQFVRQI